MSTPYPYWQKITLKNPTSGMLAEKYGQGFVLTRILNEMHQVKSLRVDLTNFQLSSENRRILRKTENFQVRVESLPLRNYDWRIHKIGVEFYRQKFGQNVFSANKIKELIAKSEKSNFNCLIICRDQKTNQDIGWCIGFYNNHIFHYAYPFYDLKYVKENLGIGIMLKTLLWAKEQGMKYFYLGSVWDKKANYKLQFSPAEFFDGKGWQEVNQLKW